MKIKCTSFISVIILTTLGLNAYANPTDNDYYASVKLGKIYASKIKRSSLPISSALGVSAKSNLNLHYKPGFSGGLAAGYKCESLRYEIEGSYHHSEYKKITVSQGANSLISPFTGRTQMIYGLGNVYYDIEKLGGWAIPYAGMGVGIAHVANHIAIERVGGKNKGVKRDTVLAVQGILGVTFNLTDAVAAIVDYRYFSTTKVKALSKNIQNNLFNIGLVYRF